MANPIESEPILKEYNKFGATMIGALLFGIGWHIRGSGTSDPAVAMLLLLLYLTVIFGPRKKFNAYIFGLIIVVFRVLRRPWGTLVGQAGIPWLYDGQYDGFGISLPWWNGYIWLFLCGAAWATLAALFLGGYMFAKKNRLKRYDVWISILLFGLGIALGVFIARVAIPHISPNTYQVYLSKIEGSVRNYQAMMNNFSVAFAIIPVLFYLGFAGKDWKFVGNSLLVIIIFGFGFSLAVIWQAFARYSPYLSSIKIDLGLWEYATGFIIGILIVLFFYRKTRKLPETKDIDINFYPKDKFWGKFMKYVITHGVLFVYGILQSFFGSLKGILNFSGVNSRDSELILYISILILLALDITLYILYNKGLIFQKFQKKSFQEKSIIWLIFLLPFYMICFLGKEVVARSLFPLRIGQMLPYIDIISFIVVEVYLITVYIQYLKQKTQL